ncbi:GNAT family N-acetyltransferase [Cyanobacteria bacterium FACHB-DQ100]|nr:GNAT family N-acetyltransferase [Cyanobacteria bacterium FACHB-DQ100]
MEVDDRSNFIGRELFLQCAHPFNEVTVNAAEAAIGFYQKVGFTQIGDRFFKHGIWGTPMKWVNPATSLLSTLRELECELHQPQCRSDRERLAQLLAPDFREFGRSGASYSRDDTLAMLPLETEAPQIHAKTLLYTSLQIRLCYLPIGQPI